VSNTIPSQELAALNVLLYGGIRGRTEGSLSEALEPLTMLAKRLKILGIGGLRGGESVAELHILVEGR
jgi:hypothetical protein